MMSSENNRGIKKTDQGVMSFNRTNVPKRYIKRMGGYQDVDEIVPPGHVWLIIGSCNFSSEIDTTVAFSEAAAVKVSERVIFSLGNRLHVNLHVAAEAGGIGVGLRKLAIAPDGVVPGQLGKYSVDYRMDETSVNDQRKKKSSVR